jgi:hypothetical protein
MASLKEVAPKLEEFSVCGCHIRQRDILAFSTQKWTVDDSLVPRETMVFFFYPNDPKDEQWAARELDRMTGVHGCACYAPQERWVFVADPGEVYVMGQGDDGEEKPISGRRASQFSAVKCIAGGFAYAVGSGREVYKRMAKDKWARLTDTKMSDRLPKDLDHAGFEDIDGFSDDNLYACGGRADLWHFDGNKWTSEDLPTDANLEKILCAPDGNVYVTTNRHQIVIGTSKQWRVIDADIGDDQFFEDIVWFDSRVLISTDDTILEVKDDAVPPAFHRLPKLASYSHLAAGDGILVVASSNEAASFDGSKWKKIF